MSLHEPGGGCKLLQPQQILAILKMAFIEMRKVNNLLGKSESQISLNCLGIENPLWVTSGLEEQL